MLKHLEEKIDSYVDRIFVGYTLEGKEHGFGIEIIDSLQEDVESTCKIAEWRMGKPFGIEITFPHKRLTEGFQIKNFISFNSENFMISKFKSTETGNDPSDGLFVGQCSFEGKKTGRGFLQKPGGQMYLGDFKQSVYHGKGIFYSNDSIYVGEFEDGEFGKYGILLAEDAFTTNGQDINLFLSYNGPFKKGLRHGVGEFVVKERTKDWMGTYEKREVFNYFGDFFGGEFHGRGVLKSMGRAFSLNCLGGIVTDRETIEILERHIPLIEHFRLVNSEITQIEDEYNGYYHHIFLDVETQKSSDECGGWFPDQMGLALAVTYSSSDGFKFWEDCQIHKLINYLHSATKIIGFNIKEFDYQVMNAYRLGVDFIFDQVTFDILEYITNKVGFRVKLEDVAYCTLGEKKIGDGNLSLKWWREGRLDLIQEYCKHDVVLTQKIFDYGVKNKKIYYSSNFSKVELPVDW